MKYLFQISVPVIYILILLESLSPKKIQVPESWFIEIKIESEKSVSVAYKLNKKKKKKETWTWPPKKGKISKVLKMGAGFIEQIDNHIYKWMGGLSQEIISDVN